MNLLFSQIFQQIEAITPEQIQFVYWDYDNDNDKYYGDGNEEEGTMDSAKRRMLKIEEGLGIDTKIPPTPIPDLRLVPFLFT